MTAQEKAKQLVDQYMDLSEEQDKTLIKYLEKLSSNSYNTPRYMPKEMAVKCALVAVDEMLEVLYQTYKNEPEYRYWLEVQNEIEKL